MVTEWSREVVVLAEDGWELDIGMGSSGSATVGICYLIDYYDVSILFSGYGTFITCIGLLYIGLNSLGDL